MRTLFYDFKIDGVPILTPDADIVIEYNDIDTEESGRDESFVMHRIVGRRNVKKWAISYSRLSREEYVYMEMLFADKDEFEVEFKDHDGSIGTCTCYRSNHSITVRNVRTGEYSNYKLSIIEC